MGGIHTVGYDKISQAVSVLGKDLPKEEKFFGIDQSKFNYSHQNAVLQCLFHTKEFRQSVIQFYRTVRTREEQPKYRRKSEDMFQYRYQRNDERNEKRSRSISPRGIGGAKGRKWKLRNEEHQFSTKSRIYQLGKIFYKCSKLRCRVNFDAQSFRRFHRLNDSVSGCCNFVRHIFREFYREEEQWKLRCCNTKSKKNMIRDFFSFYFNIEKTCGICGRINYTKNSMLTFNVTNGMLRKGASLVSTFRIWSRQRLKHKDEKFFCRNCNRKVIGEERFVLTNLPKILIVNLERYPTETNENEKDPHQPFKFLDKVMIPTSYEIIIEDTVYSLYGVVCHNGKYNNEGHYFSFLRVKNKWIKFQEREFDFVRKEGVIKYFNSSTLPIKANETANTFFFRRKRRIGSVIEVKKKSSKSRKRGKEKKLEKKDKKE